MENERMGIKWSREETILAFDLYCRTPFRKISQGNPEIIELAQLLGRTPGAVGLKMHNLAHYDPELQKRNITAMARLMVRYSQSFQWIGQIYHIRLSLSVQRYRIRIYQK